jgi:hypothetical protein
MVKQILFITFFALLYSCNSKEKEYLSGSEFIGNWHLEAIKNPKFPYYAYDYFIVKNGESFTIKVHTTCPKCSDSNAEERNYIFSGFYNEEKDVLEIEKEGYKETLSIPELKEYMVSSKFPKYIFTKIK